MSAPYDALYLSRKGSLWGPAGRLIQRIDEWLAPGAYIFDVGCGDGKNAALLSHRGYKVSGIDLSEAAIRRLRGRLSSEGLDSSAFVVGDVMQYDDSKAVSVDCLVSYGLFHCLSPSHRRHDHVRLHQLVRPGGLIIFSALIDSLPLPSDHHTPGVVPANESELHEVFAQERVLEWSYGVIDEEHLPLVGPHQHAAVWIVARRP